MLPRYMLPSPLGILQSDSFTWLVSLQSKNEQAPEILELIFRAVKGRRGELGVHLEAVQEGCLVEVDLDLDGLRSLVPTSTIQSTSVVCSCPRCSGQGRNIRRGLLGVGDSLVGDTRGCSHSYKVKQKSTKTTITTTTKR